MSDVSFSIPATVMYGLDMVNRTAAQVTRFGSRALVVTEAILYESKTIDRVQSILDKAGIQHIVFDEVVPNATSTAVEDGVNLARGSRAEVVIGMGGIRALSIGKAIAACAPTRQDVFELLGGAQPNGQPLAYIEIPTTNRNPFMFTDEYCLVDARDRSCRILRAQPGITRAVVVDPKLTLSLPPKYTATTMMETLLGAVEGYLSNKSNFLADNFFREAIRAVGDNIMDAVQHPEDIRARTKASMAGLLVGMGLTMSKQGLGAALSYALNARFLVPKSWVSTIFLPHVMDFVLPAATERLAEIARLLGEDVESLPRTEAAQRAAEVVRRHIAALSLPTRLRDFDLNLDDMIEVAAMARSYDMMNYLPRAISTEDLYELIKTAY
jgi:alcohol dehydrogenase